VFQLLFDLLRKVMCVIVMMLFFAAAAVARGGRILFGLILSNHGFINSFGARPNRIAVCLRFLMLRFVVNWTFQGLKFFPAKCPPAGESAHL
jgi:hypothetical protein